MTDTEGVDTSRDVQLELRDLATRDWQLWSIGVLVLLVVAVGFITLGLPGLLWGGEKTATVKVQFLPQLISGLIVLIVLLNIYLVAQKRRLDNMRDGLIQNVILKNAAENSPIMDRLTKVFASEYVETALEREISRADRHKSTITIGLFDVAGLADINRDFGISAGDYLLVVAAQVLKKTFRGSDTVCRYRGDQFIVILPDTSAAQAEFAFQRVRCALETWNQNSELGYDLGMCLGTATYACGVPVDELLSKAKLSLEADKHASRSPAGARLIPPPTKTVLSNVVHLLN